MAAISRMMAFMNRQKKKDTAGKQLTICVQNMRVTNEPFITVKETFGGSSIKITSDSNYITCIYKAVTLKQGGAVYSELRTICLSNFSAIPAVHHCHKLIIDQRLMRLMFTVSCLLLYPHHSYVSFAPWYVLHQSCKIKQDLQVGFPVTIST